MVYLYPCMSSLSNPRCIAAKDDIISSSSLQSTPMTHSPTAECKSATLYPDMNDSDNIIPGIDTFPLSVCTRMKERWFHYSPTYHNNTDDSLDIPVCWPRRDDGCVICGELYPSPTLTCTPQVPAPLLQFPWNKDHVRLLYGRSRKFDVEDRGADGYVHW